MKQNYYEKPYILLFNNLINTNELDSEDIALNEKTQKNIFMYYLEYKIPCQIYKNGFF